MNRGDVSVLQIMMACWLAPRDSPIHTCQVEEDCGKAIGTEVGCSHHLVPAIKSGGNAGGFDMPFSLCPGWQLADEGGRGWKG